jgi:predicted dienelactone hydrolase
MLAVGLLAVGLLAVAPTAQAAPIGAAVRPALASATPFQLTLPPPTGPHPVGTVSLHLVDPSRRDPWVTPNPVRELMVSLWYPARDAGRYPVAPWLPPGAAAQFLLDQGIPAGTVLLPATHGHDGAPVDQRGGRLPVVVYSPGNDAFRSISTVLVEELASRGYLVVTIDHTDDALVEFPDGRVVRPIPDGPGVGGPGAARRRGPPPRSPRRASPTPVSS